VDSDLSPDRPAPLVKLQCSSESSTNRASTDIGFRCSPHALGDRSLDYRVFTRLEPRPYPKARPKSSHELPRSFRERHSPSGLSPHRPTEAGPYVEKAPPVGFLPLQRLPAQGSGMIDRVSQTRPPAPSGFLDLLTPSSAPSLPTHISESDPLLGFHPPELCSSRAAVRRLQRLCPLVVESPF
jgi:hypothetical protein